MSTEEDNGDWGSSSEAVGHPRTYSTQMHAYTMYALIKRFQLMVLVLLCGFICALVALDYLTSKANLKDVLPLVLPLFTFVIGYAVRGDQNN